MKDKSSDVGPSKGGRGGARPGAGRPATGSKLYTFRAPEDMAQVIDAQQNKTDYIKGCIERTISEAAALARLGTVCPARGLADVRLPFFNIGVKAGFPIPLDNDERGQDIELLRMLCPNSEASYLIRVEGDSMIDAGIHSGDIVIVDKSNRDPSPTEVAMCELNGEYTLKRVEKSSDGGWLVPANPNYPKIRITENDDFSVWGVVTYVIHRPK